MEFIALWAVWGMVIAMAVKTTAEMSFQGCVIIWLMLALYSVSMGCLSFWGKKR